MCRYSKRLSDTPISSLSPRPLLVLINRTEVHIFKMLALRSLLTAAPPTSPAPLPEDLLQYLSSYKVVVCASCRYAIQPKAIARHLKERHRMNSLNRQPFMQHIENLELAEHELVMQYNPGEFPVPLLPVYSGLQCTSEDCTYLCVTDKRMRHHWLSVHGRQGLMASDWRSAPLQTFFMGNLLRYFTSTPSGKPTERITAQIAYQNSTAERTVCHQFNSQ